MPEYLKPFVENSALAVGLVVVMIIIALWFLTIAWRETLCWFLKTNHILEQMNALQSDLNDLKKQFVRLENIQIEKVAKNELGARSTTFVENTRDEKKPGPETPTFAIQKPAPSGSFPLNR